MCALVSCLTVCHIGSCFRLFAFSLLEKMVCVVFLQAQVGTRTRTDLFCTLAVLMWWLVVLPAQLATAQSTKYSLEAASVIGKISRHSRAIACSDLGKFQSLLVGFETDGRVSSLEICCTEGSTVWWEGQEGNAEACAKFGSEQPNRKGWFLLRFLAGTGIQSIQLRRSLREWPQCPPDPAATTVCISAIRIAS